MLDGVALVVDLCTGRKKTFAAFAAAFGKDLPTGFGGHAGAESVLALADSLGGLVSALHMCGRFGLKWDAESGERAGRLVSLTKVSRQEKSSLGNFHFPSR